MSKRKILSLPGGLKLPVSLLIETMIPCEVRTVCVSAEQAEMQLTSYAERCAEMQMRAGEVLAQQATITQRNGCYVLDSVLECHEMIAQTVEAKWNEEDFLYDGKNG